MVVVVSVDAVRGGVSVKGENGGTLSTLGYSSSALSTSVRLSVVAVKMENGYGASCSPSKNGDLT